VPIKEKKKALIVVRTYPTPAKTGVEVSCTAAITDDGKWLRIFPVPYRRLEQHQRFKKYETIEAMMTKASDPRPESHKIDYNSITIVSPALSTSGDWGARKKIIYPLRKPSLCAIKRERDENGQPTLGIFRPRVIKRLIIKPASPTWTQSQQDLLRQGHLFETGPATELEKIPFDFRYEFECDDNSCNGHTMICTDWEIGQSWRKWSKDYGDRWEEKFRERYEKDMIEKYDTHFYVGTLHQHQSTWIIVGLFYPPKSATGSLFDF
jgi:hypothetical protein